MPADELLGEVVGFVGRAALQVSSEFIFSKYGARYFHSIGRYFIAIITFGYKRIPSSLRIIPKGTKPKPTGSDWVALFTGIGVWLVALSAVVAAFML
jgi:hypothetical protein